MTSSGDVAQVTPKVGQKVDTRLKKKKEKFKMLKFSEFVQEKINEAKMTDEEVLKAAKTLAKNGDEKASEFGQGLVDFYEKNGSFTPDQVAGLQNIMKNASFQLAGDK